VGTVGNALRRSSHTYFQVGTQFLQRSVTISIRPILAAQQTTILPLMNVFIYLQAVLRIKLGPVIAPDRHSSCSPFSLPLPLPPSVSPPHSFSLSGGPAPPVKHSYSGSGEVLGAPPAGPGRVRPPNAFWCILVFKKSLHLGCLSLQYFGVSLY